MEDIANVGHAIANRSVNHVYEGRFHGRTMKSFFGYVGYFAGLLVLAWLCDVAPFIGYPLALIFLVWLLFSRGRTREVLDGEMHDDAHHHRH